MNVEDEDDDDPDEVEQQTSKPPFPELTQG
jgi:hypothetical protein